MLRIDQDGLSAGEPGRSRTDGLATGAVVTLTNTEGVPGTLTSFALLWTPPGASSALESLAPTGDSNVWTFTPTAAAYGTYLVELTENAGQVSERRERRTFGVRTPTLGLLIPALHERGSSGGAPVDNNATDYADADLNALDQAGWWRAMHELVMRVDGVTETAISDPAISRFDLTHSPVALYQFDGNLLDSSGNGFTLTGSGARYREIWPRIKGMVAGSGSRPINDALLSIAGDVTIEVLGRFPSEPFNATLVGFQGSPVAYKLAINSSDAPSWFHSSAGSILVQYTPGSGTPPTLSMPTVGIPWHLVARRASNVITFWINGVQYGAASSELTPSLGSSGLLEVRAGGGFSNLPELFGIKIIAGALTDQQIRDEYNRTLGPAFGLI